MKIKKRIVMRSELSPDIVLVDDFDPTSRGLIAKIARPEFDITIDVEGLAVSETVAPYGHPVSGRIFFILLVVAVIALIVSYRR